VRAAEPQSAGPNELAIAIKQSYAETLAASQAQAALLWHGADWRKLGLKAAIIPGNPRYAMAGVTRMFDEGQGFDKGIHPSAVIDPTADLGEDVSIGALTVVSGGVRIGPGSIIGPLCYIGRGATIGTQAYLRDHVSIGARVTIGARFIAQPGARIGSDGFSYTTPERSDVEAARESLGKRRSLDINSWTRIHSLGSVTIADDVEIGANANIDSGTIRDTVIGSGSKLDSLVHVGHNCIIGRDCLLCGLVGLAGSVTLGNHVVLGGQVGVSDNVSIGDRVIAGGGSTILSNVPAGRTVLGYPATKMDTHIQSYKNIRRLPRLFADVLALKKAVFKSGGND
jgi:UDP-3-O-[3-hydroxymyristoyl] glucosamine N-acyltransferase